MAVAGARTAYPASPPGHDHNDNIHSDKSDYNYNAASQVHTPPTTDEGSHKDDDAASSSSLSDLDEAEVSGMNMDDIAVEDEAVVDEDEDEENRQRFEDAARAGEEAEKDSTIRPHHFEGNVPVFQPSMDEFHDFTHFMTQADAYGMQHGIIKIVPPKEWRDARKPLDELVKHIKIKNPLTQEFHGAQGIYTQRNMERMRSYNLPQWKALCEQTENQPPARRGEKRLNADKLLGRGAKRAIKTEGSPAPSVSKTRGGKKGTTTERDTSNIVAPPTPTSPDMDKDIKLEEVEEDDNVSTIRETTPAKRGRGRGRGGSKTAAPRVKKEKNAASKSTETSVASRRLKNTNEKNDIVDEKAFEDFDYRVYNQDDWTQERCDELEDKYWKSLNFSNPMYAADMPGSLFDSDTKCWNVAKLPSLLDLLGAPIPGVNTAYLYLGMWRATFAWHLEDVDLYSINYIHFGAPKQWYSISQKDAPKFERAMRDVWPSDAKNCDQFLRHKTYLVSPAILKAKYGVTVNKIIHREGEFVVTYPIGYHSGYNLGYNCAESVNFALENWLQYGKTARKCQCEADSVFIDVDWFIRRMNGEPSPEYEEVEITDDEDEDDGSRLLTPPVGDRGKKTAQKRKRATKDLGPHKKAKKIVRIRKISRNQPCCLCPNDFDWEELLPTTDGRKAHKVCAMYTPETYIATHDGVEKVHNVENISKDRLELRCYECKQRKGSCFQCSSVKCVRAYHATCAMHAGVQVDKGPIAVWHEGVEYKDLGFDWRCKLHRTVKRTRITSELSIHNHSTDWLSNKEMQRHIMELQHNDVIQWQALHGDEIQAGIVVSPYDPGQNSILVEVLPDRKTVREIDPAWILFVDSSTSCLLRPSANALDLPEELQGKTASGSTENKPSVGDPFTEDPKTEWAEFVVEDPPHNKWQKRVDINKPKQVFYYLHKLSSDSRSLYASDPASRVADPAGTFLDTVQPAPGVLGLSRMAPPAQPYRRLSGATSAATGYSTAAQFRMTATANQAVNSTINTVRQTVTNNMNRQSPLQVKGEAMLAAVRNNVEQGKSPSSYRDLAHSSEARANQDARIAAQYAQRQQAYASGHNGVTVDQSAAARQRQFQQQATAHSRSMSSSSQQASPTSNPPAPPGPLYANNAGITSYRPYHNPAQNYYTNYGGYRPQGIQHTHDWMYPPKPPYQNGTVLPNPAMPMMERSADSPELGFKQPVKYTQSPTTLSQTMYPPVNTGDNSGSPNPQQSSTMNETNTNTGMPFLGVSATGQASSGTRSNTLTSTPSTSTLRNGLPTELSRQSTFTSTTSSQLHPKTPTEIERRHRLSNPSWPFKSPDQIVSQKNERERHQNGSQSSGSRPVSRPGSGYSTKAFPSPGLHAQVYGPEPQPQMYINPVATQITSPMFGPQLNTHNRAKSASISTGTIMGPPKVNSRMPSFRRTLSSNNLQPMDLDTRADFSTLGLGVSSISDLQPLDPGTLASITKPMQPPKPSSRSRRSTINGTLTSNITSPLGTSTLNNSSSSTSLTSDLNLNQVNSSKAKSIPIPIVPVSSATIAPPSPILTLSLSPRPTTRSGTPTNDRDPPQVLQTWAAHPGFWGKIATYFGQKHERAASVYKSPFGSSSVAHLHHSASSGLDQMMHMRGPSAIGDTDGLAGRWLAGLPDEGREMVELWKAEQRMDIRS